MKDLDLSAANPHPPSLQEACQVSTSEWGRWLQEAREPLKPGRVIALPTVGTRGEKLPNPKPFVLHNSQGNNEWYTPAPIIERVRRVLGAIDCDPASSDVANQTVQAAKYFTSNRSGLEIGVEWADREWLLPPPCSCAVGPVRLTHARAIHAKNLSNVQEDLSAHLDLLQVERQTAWVCPGGVPSLPTTSPSPEATHARPSTDGTQEMLDVPAGVPEDPRALLDEGQSSRLRRELQGVSAGTQPRVNTEAPPNPAGAGQIRETSIPAESQRPSMETLSVSDRQPYQAIPPSGRSFPMDARRLGAGAAGVGLSLRVLRGSGATRTGSLHTAIESAVCGYRAEQHGACLPSVQLEQGVEGGPPVVLGQVSHCPDCGVAGFSRHIPARIYSNPPYSRGLINKFCQAIAARYLSGEVAQAIVLTNNSSETLWHQALSGVASALCQVRYRIQFVGPDGKQSGRKPLQGQTLHYLGSRPEVFAAVFADVGRVWFAPVSVTVTAALAA